ncbi:MAG: ABC transporter permease [Xanthomonadales bacterium]|jgi:macrolide transport system ATP-binding/permease protein|nr:ABC transporter permease [Xanthomonadales bacterium]MCC6561188.1 ABC transporter permease [Xanthomonadales bacterium]
MSLRDLWQRLRHRRQFERDLDSELQFHFESRRDDLIRRGTAADEAARIARIELGMVELHKDSVRHALGLGAFDDWSGELRRALRSLARSPLFTLSATLILGAAIAINLVLFSVYGSYLLRTPEIVQRGEVIDLVRLYGADGSRRVRPTADELRSISPAIESDSSGLLISNMVRMMLGGSSPRTAYGLAVNGDYLPLLRSRPRIGRILDARDDVSGAAPTLLLSDAGWRVLTHSDPNVVGKSLMFSGVAFTIVGVMPPDFLDLQPLPPQFWITTEGYATWRGHYSGSDYSDGYDLSVLLTSGASPESLRQRLLPALQALASRQGKDEDIASVQLLKRTSLLAAGDAQDLNMAAVPIFALVLLVLVVACANLANLMLARATARRQELAIRASMGASRWRMVRQLMTECSLLATAAAALGLVLCALTVEPLHRYALSMMIGLGMEPIAIHIDWRVFLAATVLAGITTMSFGLLPALASTGRNLSAGARRDSVIGSITPSRLRAALMVSQIAASLVLLVVAALIVATAHRAQHIDIGFDEQRLFDLRHPAPDAALRRRIEQVPGVVGSTAVMRVPLYGWPSPAPAQVGERSRSVGLNRVDERFFSTLGIPLELGRDFRADEATNRAAVAIVSAATARDLWPGQSPIGQRIQFPPDPLDVLGLGNAGIVGEVEVVGVAADVASGLLFTGMDESAVYLPAPLAPGQLNELVVAVDPRQAAAAKRELIRICNQIDAARPCEPWALTDVVAMQRLPFEIARSVASVLGLVALLISAVGLYGVVRFTVVSRTREIGVRIALGATANGVVRLVLSGALRQVVLGVVIGLPVCLLVSWLASGTLGWSVAFTPVAYVGVPLLLMATAVLSTVLPARHATRVTPTEALRQE